MTEMHDNRHLVDLIYMHMFKLIYRSNIYTYQQALNGHLISVLITIENWPSG